MPKFVQEIIENHFWMETSFEIPEFLNEEPEVRIEDAFVPDNIETM